MKQIIRLIILLVLFTSLLLAGSDEFAEANDLYEQQEFDQALAIYSRLSADGLDNNLLEYNIATCYFRLEKPGLARLHFEKALKLSPGDADTTYNIGFIEKRYLKKTLWEENFVTIDRFLWKLVSSFPSGLTLWAGIISFILIFLLFTAKLLKPEWLNPALRWSFTIIFAIVVLLSFSVSFTKEWLINDHSYGIITQNGVGVLSAPNKDAHSRFPAPECLKVKIARVQNGWLEIILPNGSKGWVAEGDISII